MKILLILIMFSLSTGVAVACAQAIPEVNETVDINGTVDLSPSVALPTETPTLEPTDVVISVPGDGDGLSDGKSDGLSSCPDCTKAPTMPQAPPATGRGL